MDKIKKKATIRYRYNQMPHLTQDTIWESDEKHMKTSHTKESRGHPFPSK